MISRTGLTLSFGRIGCGRSCTWIGKISSHNTELSAYRLLYQLQGRYIPRLLGVVRLRITPESTPLHPITDVVQGLVLEYVPGISMDKLKPGIGVSEQEAEKISSAVLEGFRAIEAEKRLLHNDVHTRNIVLREGDQSLVIIDFGEASIQNPDYSDKEWGARRPRRSGYTLHEEASGGS